MNQLQVAWTYATQDKNSYLFNPIIVDNVMYVLARNYSLVALDAESGIRILIPFTVFSRVLGSNVRG